MSNTAENIFRDGIMMTNTSNFKSYVKRLSALDNQNDVLQELFRHHYSKGTDTVFDKIRDELRVFEGRGAPNWVPSAPRGSVHNAVRKPNGSSASILISDIIYTKQPGTGVWTYKGGKKSRKQKRKTRRSKTRRHA